MTMRAADFAAQIQVSRNCALRCMNQEGDHRGAIFWMEDAIFRCDYLGRFAESNTLYKAVRYIEKLASCYAENGDGAQYFDDCFNFSVEI